MKIIGRIIGALLLIAVVAVVSLLFLPADRIARLAAEQIKAQTGREVSITGDVSMTLWPVLGVSAGSYCIKYDRSLPNSFLGPERCK